MLSPATQTFPQANCINKTKEKMSPIIQNWHVTLEKIKKYTSKVDSLADVWQSFYKSRNSLESHL